MKVLAALATISLLVCSAACSTSHVPGGREALAASIPGCPDCVVQKGVFPLAGVAYSFCQNEDVAFTGEVHVTAHLVQDSAGALHLRYHEELRNLVGTGLTTGLKYRVPGTFNATLNFPFNRVSEVLTFRLQEIGVVQGAAANLKVQITEHVTVNANGQVTAVKSDVEATCQ